jgi:hypothetical protein
MKRNLINSLLTFALAGGLLPIGAQAQPLVISEVDPAGSSASYGADWFELENTGASAIDITGWEMDDNSAMFSKAVPLTGITSIAAGQTVVFIEDTGMTDATLDGNFINTWFGGNAPAGLTIGNYGGSGVSLSTGGDAVNIFDSTGTLEASVTFGAAPAGATFDNTAGVNNTTFSSTPTISQASVADVNGAFSDGSEIGSPGNVAPVPEPSTLALASFGGLAALIGFRRLKNRQA